ncbi:MAG TPA: ABC transporter permease [Kofleriaceae bacterium]|jgi:lipoprotein-releasing system permease protein|nr:ABC transporter permease [Kofleriaceae bacterium]
MNDDQKIANRPGVWVSRSGFGLGYKSFVAWRYLLEQRRKLRPQTLWLLVIAFVALALVALLHAFVALDPIRGYDPLALAELVAVGFFVAVVFFGVLPHSKLLLISGIVGVALFAPSLTVYLLLGHGMLANLHLDLDRMATVAQWLKGVSGFGAGVAGLSVFFGLLRTRFTFFTTVPIGGVWIGTAALVIVLSVMGGFESDLREKILGSNAHIQIAREDGDFVDWRAVKAQIDAMPGVVASTPYAVSEVVIAASGSGMPVIIKGIDPATVGKVTDLVSDLEDRDAMKRLQPLIDDARDLRVPQHPRTGPVIDPPPADMPTPGDPIDFSSPGPGSGSGSTGPADDGGASGSGAGAGAGDAPDGGDAFGGDAVRVIGENDPPPRPPRAPPGDGARAPAGQAGSGTGSGGAPAVVDPPPRDLITSDEPPADYSQPDYLQDAVKVIEPPFDSPSISRRTQSLPGILVGRELVKQTHMYTGEEVRVVSPLSDPANPDATGTPIPFNRDYRVAGTFFTGMYEYDLKYVYVTLDSLQEFLDRGDAVDGIEVRVTNPYDSEAFVARFQAAFGPGYRVQDWKELNRSLFSALKLEKIAMFLVLGIVILVASFSIVGNLIMVVVEKAREIALLKTLGASDAGVAQLFAIQGLMIGLIGTVLGVGTGLIGCWALSVYGFPLNENVYYIDRLPVHVDPGSVVAAAAAGIVISIGATLYPAVVAARVRPAAGMRH